MNELQRQHYLSSLGIDTYMPRWQLPFAPSSVQCSFPVAIESIATSAEPNHTLEKIITSKKIPNQVINGNLGGATTSINNLINDIFDTKKISKIESKSVGKSTDSTVLKTSTAIDAFSLSVWRPFEKLLVIDSRDTKLALPTEMLLKNILNNIFKSEAKNFKEEVLRCPMIENSFAKRTSDDARAELQTWLSVQSEIRPFEYLWLMGANASQYFLSKDDAEHNYVWSSVLPADSSTKALILPSLNELLLNPLLKKNLIPSIRQYQF